MNKMKILYN